MKTKQALTDTIGNKAANLVVLDTMLKDYAERLSQLETLAVAVPQICPLTHQAISTHLTMHAPAWVDLWAQFKRVQPAESNDLTADSVELLKRLRQLIKDTFTQYPYPLDEWSGFLNTMDPDSRLMVRSSGKEDAVDIANPGGNESVASVSHDPLLISQAMGIVVASYFSEKSLLQRLAGKQDILDEAFMPVLLQKMIGDIAGHVNNPVVSGVMYTSSAGIQIQMAPGHGEYIVNSKGPFDTVYVSPEHVVHAEINEKKLRLVPGESGLRWQVNTPALAKSLSIERRVAADIAIVGRCIHAYYAMPMDVEFVYDPALHSLYLVQARPIPPGRSKLISPSSIAPQHVLFVKAQGEAMKAQVITPAGNAIQLITKPEEILITSHISDASDTYLHHQDSPIKAVVISEKAPQTSHEAAQFNAMGIPVLQVSAAQLKHLDLCMQKPAPVLILDPQRKLIIDWTKQIKNHANAQGEIDASGIIEDGLFQSSLSIYESLLPLFKKRPIQVKPVPDELSSSIGALIDKANSDDLATSEQAFNALMQRLFRNLTTCITEPVSLYDTFEQLKANRSMPALKIIVSQLYHLARKTHETAEMQTCYRLIFQYAVIDAADIAGAISNPAITQQDWLDTVARLELLVTAPFNTALHTSSIHQLLEIRQSREKASIVSGFKDLTDEQQQYFTSFFQLGKLIANKTMKAKWTKFAMDTCKQAPNYQALATLMYFFHENGIAADWLNRYFDPTTSIASMGAEGHKIIEELRPLNLPDIRNTINTWEKRLVEWSNPKNFEQLYADYILDITMMIEHLDMGNNEYELRLMTGSVVLKPGLLYLKDLGELGVEYTVKRNNNEPARNNTLCAAELAGLGIAVPIPTHGLIKALKPKLAELLAITLKRGDTNGHRLLLTQKTVLKVVQDLTDVMDKTIKSLKGSVAYREHGELLVGRFYKLLLPYKYLMDKWINVLPLTVFKDKAEKLKRIDDRFSVLANNTTVSQLNPSGLISIPVMTIDNFSLSRLDFNVTTLEDLFSLIHQNILIATAWLGKESQIKLEQLPDALRDIHQDLAGQGYKMASNSSEEGDNDAILLSTRLAYPLIHLDYNLPLRHHSAKFLVDFNQDTGDVTLNVKFFGHNASQRMDKIASLAQHEGLLLGVNVVRQPQYNANAERLEWTWHFESKSLQRSAGKWHDMIQDYVKITYYEQGSNPIKAMYSLMMRYPGFQIQTPVDTPEKLQQFISALPLNSTDVHILLSGIEVDFYKFLHAARGFLTISESLPGIHCMRRHGFCPPVKHPAGIMVETMLVAKTMLMRVFKKEQSIQLFYVLMVDTSKVIMNSNAHLLSFSIDYNVLENTFDLHVDISLHFGQPNPPFDTIPFNSILLGAELEGALLNAQIISPPHYNDQRHHVAWCWRFGCDENMAELSQHLLKSFIYYAYYHNDFFKLLHNHAEIAKTPARYEQIIQCVKDFFEQNKHKSDSGCELVQLDDLKYDLPPALLPAARRLHLFDKREQVEDMQSLDENEDRTSFKGP